MTLLTTQRIAELLGISDQAAQKRLWRAGIQPVQKIGRTNVYDQSVLDEITSDRRSST